MPLSFKALAPRDPEGTALRLFKVEDITLSIS
jgi:hypothetical protein